MVKRLREFRTPSPEPPSAVCPDVGPGTRHSPNRSFTLADSTVRSRTESVPNFRIPDSKGHVLELESFLGKTAMVFVFLDHLSERDLVVLHEIDNRLEEFGSKRAQVLVVMDMSARETREMAEELDLSVPILADESGAMARDFGVTDQSGPGNRPVGIVADTHGDVQRRFGPPGEGEGAGKMVDAILGAVRPGSRRVSSDVHPIESDDEFYARVADEARIPAEEAPVLVSAFLNALAPFLGEEGRVVVRELAPEGMEVPEIEKRDPEAGVEDLLQTALEDSSIASGRPAEHARVVAEALRSRADEGQLRRLERSVEDEDVLSLFEVSRGELTAHHELAGVQELTGKVGRDDPPGT
jgi:peroxiredoxin